MAYSKDIKFIRSNKLNAADDNARINDCDDLWFANEEELLPIDSSWDAEYVDLVKTDFKSFVSTNSTTRALVL